MFSALRRARAGGLRAGIAPRNRYQAHPDGTKTIAFPCNPYTGKRRLLAAIWENYYWIGFNRSLRKGK